jgi:hypothetical protein
LKPIIFPMIAFALVAVLSACSLQNQPSGSTQIASQNPAGTAALTILPVNATPTSPTDTPPAAIASPVFMTIVPNTPTWSVYNYTCALATGGANMTMNLAWKDRSNSEEGYRVYRDKQVIATLPANSTAYVDVVFVATGGKVSYSVEAFSQNWRFSTPTVSYGCQ